MPPEPPVSKRKHHNKSRAGCKNCKARRVKCDESHPTCRTCTRRRETCLWDDDPSFSSFLSHSNDSALLATSPLARILAPSPSSTNLGTLYLPDFDMKSLELLHHFTTSTVLTFVPEQSETCYGFQVVAPRLAFQNPCLMHSIFAMSSLHIHTRRPSGEYLTRAKSHLRKALQDMQRFQSITFTPCSAADTQDTQQCQTIMSTPCSATTPSDVFFLTNALIATYCLASPSWKPLAQDGTPDLFDWIPAARTFMLQLGSYWDGVEKRIIHQSPFLSYHATQIHMDAPSLDPLLLPLFNLLNPELCPMDMDELLAESTLQTYRDMIMALHHASNAMDDTECVKILSIYVFPPSMSDSFIEFFAARKPRALIIVAHFCAMLGQFDGTWWYGADRSKNDIQRIVSLLPGEEWLTFMEYPLSTIGKRRDQEVDHALSAAFLNEMLAFPSQGIEADLSLSSTSMNIGDQPSWTPPL